MINLKLTAIPLIATVVFLSGCASVVPEPQWSEAAQARQSGTGIKVGPSETGIPTEPSIEYIRIKTERSIFMDPPENNVDVYVRVGDNSARKWGGISIKALIEQGLRARGFNPVSGARAKNAAYALQVNVLIASEVSAAELGKLDETQFGQGVGAIARGALAGAAVGSIGASLSGGDSDAVLLGGVGGAVVGGILNFGRGKKKEALLKAQQATQFFSFITDVEVRERAIGTVTRSGELKTGTAQSISSPTSQTADGIKTTGGDVSYAQTETETFTEQSKWKRHRTRMIGKAKGKLVVFEDVEKDFAVQMARAIAGFF